MTLETLDVKELSHLDLISVDGGNWINGAWKVLEKIGTAIAIGDAIDESVDGWNSVECTHP